MRLKEKIKALDVELVDFASTLIKLVLSILALFSSVLFAITILILIPLQYKEFVKGNYLESIETLVLVVIIFYLGRGIRKIIDEKEKLN
jgi:hypothetical protein